MLKFVAGYVKDSNNEKIKAMIFGFNHTAIAHADLANYLNSPVIYAGFCDLAKENLFMQFYGKSISVKVGCENMDVLESNNFIKNGFIKEYNLNFFGSLKTIYVVAEKDIYIEHDKLVFSETINIEEWNDLLDDQFRTQF